jgi:FkbM family methyltransferase
MSASASTAVTASGRPIHVDPADPRSAALVAASGNFNPRSLELWELALALHPWDVVVDVGTNYGEMLVNPDLPVGATVIGFEPNPAIRPHLARTLADNGLDVRIVPAAVADRPGTASFHVDPTWSGTSSLAPDASGAGGDLEVAVTTLDTELAEMPGSVCVKVDVEGFEPAVVAGSTALMARPAWAMMLEILHLDRAVVADLAARWPAYVLADGALVRLVHVEQLDREGTYGQDLVLVAPEIAPDPTVRPLTSAGGS